MKLLKTLFMAALFSFGASYAHACGVDAVAGKTDTTITISWDVNCNKFLKVEICWKNAANSGNVCNAPAIAFYTTTGSYTIAGLQPQTPYKIKTHWRTNNSSWREITTRIVTTNPSPAATTTVLRYLRATKQGYCVDFYWKNPPTPPATPNQDATLALLVKHQSLGTLGSWVTAAYDAQDHDLSNAPLNIVTAEYTKKVCGFNNNRRYKAYLYWRKGTVSLGQVSNEIEWK